MKNSCDHLWGYVGRTDEDAGGDLIGGGPISGGLSVGQKSYAAGIGFSQFGQ